MDGGQGGRAGAKMVVRKTNMKRFAAVKKDCAYQRCNGGMKKEDLAECCKVCETWCHTTYEKITKSVYVYMVKDAGGEQLKWHCNHCKVVSS